MFLPTTPQELQSLGWDALDVILVTGDSYVDSPYIGVAVIGKVLLAAGYRVGIIAQPDVSAGADICRLGEPRLFWGVSGGSVDSMVANYTATRKKRKQDDYTPGGVNNRRPDRAVIVYANLIRRYFKNTAPIVLGGIEASLRRVAHYDYWDNKIRGAILFDAKADYLIYGMAEKTVLQLAAALQAGEDPRSLRGLCTIAKDAPDGYLRLPSLAEVRADKRAFIEMFHTFYHNNDPLTAKGLAQPHGDRCLVQNPPAVYETQAELDAIYALDYERAQHPFCEAQGKVRALDTIKFSISTHRGCYGECNFCAIAVHEGRTVRWRSQESIVAEARQLTYTFGFKGIIQDVGGPTANMYAYECDKKLRRGVCENKRCTFPGVCPLVKPNHQAQIDLLRKIRCIPGVRKVFVASGVRYDLLLEDGAAGNAYLKELVQHHVSGQMKVAPEHVDPRVLGLMGKPGADLLLEFKRRFEKLTREAGKPQFLTYYLIAAHPGCSEVDMQKVQRFAAQKLKIHPEQVQVFTPTPSTYSTLMYYTEMDPFTLEPLFVEKDLVKKARQKDAVTGKQKGAGN
ncbi:MAG: YgiQ family radical SAM protein [Chloroflexota bacterium]